jgi:hypothetical protein
MTDSTETNEASVAMPDPADITNGDGGTVHKTEKEQTLVPKSSDGTTASITTAAAAAATISSTTTTTATVASATTPSIPAFPKQELQRKGTPAPQDLAAMAATGPLMAHINKEASTGGGHMEPRTLAMIERRSRQISKDKLTKEAFMGGIAEEATSFDSETKIDDKPKPRLRLGTPHPKDMKTLVEGMEYGDGHDGHDGSSRVPTFLKRLPFFRKTKAQHS